MNKLKAIICAALSVCMIAVPVASHVVLEAGAESVKSLQDRLDELEQKSDQYQDILNNTQSDIAEKEAYGDALINKIQVIDEKIILTRESITKLNASISEKQGEIDEGNKDIEDQLDALSERLRVIYMAGSASDLELVLGAKDFNDFIDKVSLVKTLSNYDRELIDGINEKLVVINQQKDALETDKTKLEEQEESLNSDLEELNKLAEENKEVLKELTQKSEAARAALQNSSSESARIEAEIAKYFAEQEAARQKAAEEAAKQNQNNTPPADSQSSQSGGNNGGSSINNNTGNNPAQGTTAAPADDEDDDDDDDDYGGSSGYDDTPSVPSGGGYVWPCPGFYYLSSLWNEDRTTYNHGAIDIAGGGIHGATVVAASGGTVLYTCTSCIHDWGKDGSCGCGGGYGNYVWIDHGNGKETIYAHLCKVTVSPGQYVSAGQTVGYVGSTGYSTGPHLHFECRYNGVKYNPMTEF